MSTIRILLWLASLLTLAAVLMLYLQPGFMVLLAEQVWACF
ncbi:MAG: hypothetical protein WA917_12695 [Comamonas sp.]